MSARHRLSRIPEQRDAPPPRGLPSALPEGEALLWQGSPAWRSLARHCCHVPALAIYFGLLLAWNTISTLRAGMPLESAAISTLRLAGLALAALGLLTTFAVLVGRTTVYTVTSRRVVISFGIAMPMTVNLPFRTIEQADLRRYADGSGDIALSLGGGKRPGYVVMWPHTRPWRFGRAQPMLRGVPDAERVAQLLGRGLAASAEQTVAPLPEDAPAGGARPRAAAAA